MRQVLAAALEALQAGETERAISTLQGRLERLSEIRSKLLLAGSPRSPARVDRTL